MRARREPSDAIRVLACVLLVGAFLVGLHGPASGAESGGGTLVVRTVPATPGVRVSVDGTTAVTDRLGVARLEVGSFEDFADTFRVLPTRVSRTRRVALDRILGRPARSAEGRDLVIGLCTERLVRLSFVDRSGQEVPHRRVSLTELRSNNGQVEVLTGREVGRPYWLASGRTQETRSGLVGKELSWSVSRVVVDGAEVVNRGQQVFVPARTSNWSIGLLFYRVTLVGRDLFFGGAAGEGIEITQPDGQVRRVRFDDSGVATLDNLPRGEYDVRVYGPGISFVRPMSVSRNQVADIEVITDLDAGLVLVIGLFTAVSLVVVGRRHHLAARGPLWERSVRLLGVSTTALALFALGAVVVRSLPAISG